METGVAPDHKEINVNPEILRLQKLAEKFEDRLGATSIVEVPGAGYVLQFENQKPMAGNDWVLADLDDTLVAYASSKESRQNLFEEYAKSRGLNLTGEQLSKLMDITDKFSRWKVDDKAGDQYHLDAHMASLQWAINEISGSASPEESILQIEEKLNIIKGKPEEIVNLGDVPFYIRREGRKFIVKGGNTWSKSLEEVFTQSMFKPERYRETIQALTETSGPRESFHRTNIGIFTYGDPYFQLSKVMELAVENPDLPLSQIWLTRIPKGEFIKSLSESGANTLLEQDYIPPQRQIEDEGIAPGSGYALGQSEHIVVVFDDSPKELTSIRNSNKDLADKSGATIIAVRSRRERTKEGAKDWTIDTPYGEVNFSMNYAPSEISNIFLINRYLGLKSRLGTQNPRTASVAEQLVKKGVAIEQINKK